MLGRSALLAATNVLDYGNWLGNYSDVSLLLRNGTPVLIPLDESTTPKVITAVGNASATTAIARWNEGSGGSSLAFDGSGDYLSIPKDTDFEFGNGDFTVECWVRLNATNVNQAFAWYGAGASGSIIGWGIRHLTTGFQFYFYTGSTLVARAHPVVASANVWYHVAAVRNGSSLILYIDGVPSATTTTTASINAPTGALLTVGSAWTSFEFLNGYIDDLRITKGIARYTSNFTPPTTELPANITDDPSYNSVSLLLRNGTPSELLIPLDESPTPKTITAVGDASITTAVVKYGTSAMKFDGSGDYFETPATTDFDFANNPFTIEAWINVSVLTSLAGVITVMNNLSGPDLDGYGLIVDSDGTLKFLDYVNGSAAFGLSSSAGAITTGQWYHVAVCKEGTSTNQVRLFVNGQIVASGTRNANIPAATTGQPARIGAWRYPTALRYFNGYIDDLRITKGIARYTSNFTPPPAELPNF